MKSKNIFIAAVITIFAVVIATGSTYGAKPKEKEDLIRVNYIHYVKQKEQRIGAKQNSCYKLMGVKWNTTSVSYVINPNNPDGLTREFVTSTVQVSAENWDTYTSRNLFNDSYIMDTSAVYGIRDFKNSIVFDAYPSTSAIAVTSVWYTRVGKQIVEFDQIYNTYFNWGDASIDLDVMDFENIVTHELGHAVGMNDIYNSTCSDVTMYGYSTEGETSKRTLEVPDITGLQKMYGL